MTLRGLLEEIDSDFMELTWGERKCLYGAHLAEMQNDFMELTQGDRNFTELS